MTKHILVLNDTAEILQLFEVILHGEAGYKVTVGTYKPLMIDWIKQLNPDLVITDLLYGEEVTGWQLIDKMRMDRKTAEIPIIVCTADVEGVKEREGVLAEKNIAVVLKPFDIDDLLLAVETKLNEEKGSRQLEQVN